MTLFYNLFERKKQQAIEDKVLATNRQAYKRELKSKYDSLNIYD
jgi:hypothetical protein